MPYKKIILSVCLSLIPMLSHAAEESPNADRELYRAAMLHKGGETPAAIGIWQKWAQQGNVDAAYNLALIHQHADGVVRNDAEALRWYRYAAERGDKPSQTQLGLIYMNGDGVPADSAKAQEWFTKSRREHAHHHHNAQFQQWQKQARALIEERDRHGAAIAAIDEGAQTLAELKRRAGMTAKLAAK
ncbi:MAG: tetratricopeptide repeat protein [Sulfuricellaceae bacterium]|nr:tetratricopeptide repeat protein [Sulfuricellaceae bacterium]